MQGLDLLLLYYYRIVLAYYHTLEYNFFIGYKITIHYYEISNSYIAILLYYSIAKLLDYYIAYTTLLLDYCISIYSYTTTLLFYYFTILP